MSVVSVDRVHKVYQTSRGPTHAVRGVSFDVAEGETLAVLGPSGCGKSSMMRMIAGLEHISSGSISIAGQRVNDVPAERRNISLAFENYALYPAMTVRENLEFPLRNLRTLSRSEIDKQVAEIAHLFRLTEVLARKPAELSGGHRQMVSLGRALIKPATVYILDEPLSHLDLQFRNEVVARLKTLQRERRMTMILITHDQAEALEFADRVAVMNEGLLQQIGAPTEIVGRPANLFVAGFVGEPPMNMVECRIDHKRAKAVTDLGSEIALPPEGFLDTSDLPILIGVRPSDLSIANGSRSRLAFGPPLSLMMQEQLGEMSVLTFDLDGKPVRVVARRRDLEKSLGKSAQVAYRPDALHVFDQATGQRVRWSANG
jgi:ABC-type sugar transport system ATPase subunit